MDGVAHCPGELVDEAAEGVDHGGQGVVAAGFAQVVLGGGSDVRCGAVEVEMAGGGVDVDEQVDDVAGAAGAGADVGDLLVAGWAGHGPAPPSGAGVQGPLLPRRVLVVRSR